MGKVGAFWSSIDQKTKMIIIIAIIIVIAFIFWQLYKEWKRAQERKNPQLEVNAADADVKSEQAKGETLSFTDSSYTSSANTIQDLLSGCETFQSEIDAIKEVIKVVKKPIDWYYLVKTFGTREIAECGTFGWSTYQSALGSLLKEQLDTWGAWYDFDNINGYSDSGYATESITALEKFMKSKGINF